ncbi:MAG TPA: rRNA adenine N-6-methyltransferase family protein, partial [Candidatus Acidoferrum sp.]|nr:rRNA adenine N-6-methyltransferase family protein [Candidatus Acidoferrum sp.]
MEFSWGSSFDWAKLWQELASDDIQAGFEGEVRMVERWRRVARQLDAGERGLPDLLLDHILERLTPEMAVLDIGAGIGRWTLPFARVVRQVTAVEPLAGMRQVLMERVTANGITNLQVVDVPWLKAEIPPHDVVVAAHATYTTTDLLGFVRKMDACARRRCYLALRVPAHDGIIGELSERLRGCWHDSPNFIVGYNLLLSAGFYGNVVMEPRPLRFWTDVSVDEAVVRAKR